MGQRGHERKESFLLSEKRLFYPVPSSPDQNGESKVNGTQMEINRWADFFTGWEGRRGPGRGGGRARNRNLGRYFFFAKSVGRWSRETLKRNAIDFQEHTDKFYPN